MQKYKKIVDTWRSKKKKIGTHEGSKVLKKMSKWRLIYKKIIKMNDSHVSWQKVERDYIYKRSIVLVLVHIFHTHAHLDLRVWHFSPRILDLTLQYMQYKYDASFIPT
jgi:hypothetical protein